MSKKWMSRLLAGALAFTTVFGTGFTAKADDTNASKDQITVYVAAEGQDEEGHSVDTGKIAIVVDEGSTVEEAAREAFTSHNIAYDFAESEYGAYINAIGDITAPADWTKGYWSFWVNGEYSMSGISQTALTDNDKVSMVFAYGKYAVATGAAVYADDPAKNPDSAKAEKLLTEAKAQQDVLADAIYDQAFGDGTVTGIEQPNNLYIAFSLLRAGYKADDYFNKMYEKVAAQLKELKEKGTVTIENEEKDFDTLVKANPESAYAKIVLFVTAMGKDARDIGGYDLIEAMADKSTYEKTAGQNMRDCTMLLAFDSADYQLPTGDNYITRAELVKNVTGQVGTAIASVATASSMFTVDDVAMPLQALSPYLSGENSADVVKACTRGVHFMESMQNQQGAYSAWGSDNNVYSLAQVMTAMGQLRVNPCSEADGSDFIKEGNTVLDAAAAFVNTDEKSVDADLMGWQPEQLLRGLNAVIRVMTNNPSLYALKEKDPVSSDEPVQSPSAVPSNVPSVNPTTVPSQTPAVSGTPVPSATVVPTKKPSATVAPTKKPSKTSTKKTSVVKKVQAAKTKVSVKKGKKAVLKWNVTTTKNASIAKKIKVSVNEKNVKVVKKSVKKKKATQSQVTVTIKGVKKGKAVVTLNADSKKSKVTVTVK